MLKINFRFSCWLKKMWGADREHDEDDEAGAEESDPGYAQDSHALEKDFSWYYWGVTGVDGRRKRGKGGGKCKLIPIHCPAQETGPSGSDWRWHLPCSLGPKTSPLKGSSCSGCNLQGGLLLLLLLLLLLDAELLLLLPHIDLPRFCQLPSDVSPHAPFTP